MVYHFVVPADGAAGVVMSVVVTGIVTTPVWPNTLVTDPPPPPVQFSTEDGSREHRNPPLVYHFVCPATGAAGVVISVVSTGMLTAPVCPKTLDTAPPPPPVQFSTADEFREHSSPALVYHLVVPAPGVDGVEMSVVETGILTVPVCPKTLDTGLVPTPPSTALPFASNAR